MLLDTLHAKLCCCANPPLVGQNGPTLKGKNLLLLEQILPFQSWSPLKGKQKLKMARVHFHESIPNPFKIRSADKEKNMFSDS